jgi:hypothetical protein
MKRVIVLVVVALVVLTGVASGKYIFLGQNEKGLKFYLISDTVEGNTATIVALLRDEEREEMRSRGFPERLIQVVRRAVYRVECTRDKATIVEFGAADGSGNIVWSKKTNMIHVLKEGSPMKKLCDLILDELERQSIE